MWLPTWRMCQPPTSSTMTKPTFRMTRVQKMLSSEAAVSITSRFRILPKWPSLSCSAAALPETYCRQWCCSIRLPVHCSRPGVRMGQRGQPMLLTNLGGSRWTVSTPGSNRCSWLTSGPCPERTSKSSSVTTCHPTCLRT